MTLPCPHYAPVSGSHFSQLLITRQCRVLPLPTSCQPFPPSLTSRATQPPPSPQGVASFNLAQSSCPAYLLPQFHPFQSCKSSSFAPIPSHSWTLPRLNGISPTDRTLPTADLTRSFVDCDSLIAVALCPPQDVQPCLSQILLCPSTDCTLPTAGLTRSFVDYDSLVTVALRLPQDVQPCPKPSACHAFWPIQLYLLKGRLAP